MVDRGASLQIWRGNQTPSIVDGIRANGSKDGVAMEDGPKVGAETQWTTMPGVHGMHGETPPRRQLLPANKKYTAAVTGIDRDQIEQVAKAVLARLEAM